jgi:hypothetical protein
MAMRQGLSEVRTYLMIGKLPERYREVLVFEKDGISTKPSGGLSADSRISD